MSQQKASHEALRAMLKKANEKLAVATKDLEAGFFGDAASRAYYAAFHAVTAVLAERNLAFSSHAKTLGAFNREFVKTKIFPPDTFRKLQRLFEDRHTGDYDWSRSIDQKTAVDDIAQAEWILNACTRHLENITNTSLSDNT